ncbi:MAG TPA: tubulin/FtsZ family protein [Methanocorpusculum sp.]|nr:tubulin/FtsZ family protein [Methanocorpusculum sp.]
MKALLIGLGGAGCRIVDTLNMHDERSGVRSVQSFAFDADQKTISEIQTISTENRFILTPVDPVKEHNNHGTDFEVGNLASCFQRDNIEEIDAVFICAGLGGRMAELVPNIISQLNNTSPDPVFTILTLPGRNEGVKISARASETLAKIRKVSQATILFDNETWFKRTEEENSIKKVDETKHKATIYEMFPVLNEILARRVGLLLRAGEFNHKGVEAAEVVLDAGEILNTLKGMDLVAIGYAIEKLPTVWTNNVMKRIRVEKYLLEENQARTSRIVELAKQAVYREVSIPCDLTSSEKALVLIAGPSDELSMKGFQTVRKWIDRSIKGLEMRAGDYPVTSTQYVGVIIVLAGLENVPRVKELDEIRTIYENELIKENIEKREREIAQTIQIANDDILFENEIVMPIGITPAPILDENEDEFFELDDFINQKNETNNFQKNPQKLSVINSATDIHEEEDRYNIQQEEEEKEEVLEEKIRTQLQHNKKSSTTNDNNSSDGDVKREIPLLHQQYMPPNYDTFQFKDRKKNKERAKSDDMPKITIISPKKQLQINNSTIMVPKRQKKVDNVLAGMVNIDGKKKIKESDNVLSGKANIGNNVQPKEMTTTKILEGTITIKHQRPKETNRNINISSCQRPKETMNTRVLEGIVNVDAQRPKENDDGTIIIRNAKKPREVSKGIRITSIPIPKNLDFKKIMREK